MQIKTEVEAEQTSIRDIKQEETNKQSNNLTVAPSLDRKSRKIQKKREKYHKIDDNIRLQLLDAVHQKGELLKTAAKRLNVNYSSAKSIFFTYRKEGRIIKKTVKNRPSKREPISTSVLSQPTQQLPQYPLIQTPLCLFKNPGSLLQTVSGPLANMSSSAQLTKYKSSNFVNQCFIPLLQQKTGLGWSLNQTGMPNAFKQSLDTLTLLNPRETPYYWPGFESKPSTNFLDTVGILPSHQIQSILKAIKIPITSLSSLVGSQGFPENSENFWPLEERNR